MFHYLTVALLAVATPLVLAEPSGLLTIGGPIIGTGLGGLGHGGLGGLGLGLGLGGVGGLGLLDGGHLSGGAILAAPASVSVQKTVIAHPAPAHVAIAAPAHVAIAAPALAIPSPVATSVIAGPSGVINAKQSLAGTFATVTGPASINLGHGLEGH